jgi:hypothetical protein
VTADNYPGLFPPRQFEIVQQIALSTIIFHSRLRDSRSLAGLRSLEIEGRVLHLLYS